jgi:hypothetical protein
VEGQLSRFWASHNKLYHHRAMNTRLTYNIRRRHIVEENPKIWKRPMMQGVTETVKNAKDASAWRVIMATAEVQNNKHYGQDKEIERFSEALLHKKASDLVHDVVLNMTGTERCSTKVSSSPNPGGEEHVQGLLTRESDSWLHFGPSPGSILC